MSQGRPASVRPVRGVDLVLPGDRARDLVRHVGQHVVGEARLDRTAEQHAHIELAAHEPLARAGGRACHHIHSDQRMPGAQRGQHLPDPGARLAAGAHRQVPFDLPLELTREGREHRLFVQQCFCFLGQQLSGVRQLQAAIGSHEQLRAEALLDGAHMRAGGRLAHVQPLGGTRQVLLLRHGNEGSQLDQIDQHLLPQSFGKQARGIPKKAMDLQRQRSLDSDEHRRNSRTGDLSSIVLDARMCFLAGSRHRAAQCEPVRPTMLTHRS